MKFITQIEHLNHQLITMASWHIIKILHFRVKLYALIGDFVFWILIY